MADNLTDVARMVAEGTMSLTAAVDLYPSCSQKCLLALASGNPGLAPEPYDVFGGAWLRLDEQQRDILRAILPRDQIAQYVADAQACREVANHGGVLSVEAPADWAKVDLIARAALRAELSRDD